MPTRLVSRPNRRSWAVLAGIAAAAIAWGPVAATSWGTVTRVSADYTYTNGNALARTVTSTGTAKLHVVYTDWNIGGQEVSNSGPYQGVYYRRGSASGGTWGTPKRLNGSTTHGDYGTIEASGKYVYVAWRKQPVVSGPSTDPTPLQFRRNTNHGAADAWRSQPSFLGADRVARPSIAATGSKVWIAYTDAVGGEIRLQRSTDYGATFEYLGAVGATTREDGPGYSGRPQVAATGNTVAIAYDNGSALWLRISIDNGASWAVDQAITDWEPLNWDIDGASGRVAVAYLDDGMNRIHLRRWNGTTLGAQRTAVTVTDTTTYKEVNAPAIALSGTSVVGIAFTACSVDPCAHTSTSGTSVRWIESRDAGASWKGLATVGSYAVSSSRRANGVASVVWGGSSRRVVTWTASPGSGVPDRLLVRIGTGTP